MKQKNKVTEQQFQDAIITLVEHCQGDKDLAFALAQMRHYDNPEQEIEEIVVDMVAKLRCQSKDSSPLLK